ncbi:hypothetical protein [Sphingomonas sp. Leaf242]|uniref:hypothetical protein n=1 Tax=Sphingomonas sp. Leaf242 TaxID=1736304 RepID=UPI000715DCB9|nr:hypothetical protein [Sphingomonas sp. Leaf242]KQO13420.1 hypothetical protein ASF09_04055 [Sphingomonas sp. Leaf242]
MAKREAVRPDVLELLEREFQTTIRYQKKQNDITVTMTFDEYLSLWSNHRIRSMGQKIDQGPKVIDFYMKNTFRPVCSWVSRDALVRGGTMTVENAKITSAEDSKRLFQFKPGDKHQVKSKDKIRNARLGKSQTPEHVAKRTAGQKGVKRRPMSEQAKAKMRATRAANNASKGE